MRSRLVALLLLTTGCTHTVTVLAPVADVPAETHVVAAITPGTVTQLPPEATLREGGIVVTEGKSILAHLAPADEVAVRVSGGERFGNIGVYRKPGYDGLMVLGVVIILGGLTTSFVLAGSCNGYSSSLQPGCAAIAAGGSAASLAGGITLVAYGLHGEIVVKPTGVAGKF